MNKTARTFLVALSLIGYQCLANDETKSVMLTQIATSPADAYNDTLPHPVVNIDLEAGGLIKDYLPFDIPFILTGKIAENVEKVVVIYGPSKWFHKKRVKLFDKDGRTTLDSVAERIHNSYDVTGEIQVSRTDPFTGKRKTNDTVTWNPSAPIYYDVWTKPIVKVDCANGSDECQSFIAHINPLIANKSYNFFIRIYTKEGKREEKTRLGYPLEQWLAKELMKWGKGLIAEKTKEGNSDNNLNTDKWQRPTTLSTKDYEETLNKLLAEEKKIIGMNQLDDYQLRDKILDLEKAFQKQVIEEKDARSTIAKFEFETRKTEFTPLIDGAGLLTVVDNSLNDILKEFAKYSDKTLHYHDLDVKSGSLANATSLHGKLTELGLEEMYESLSNINNDFQKILKPDAILTSRLNKLRSSDLGLYFIEGGAREIMMRSGQTTFDFYENVIELLYNDGKYAKGLGDFDKRTRSADIELTNQWTTTDIETRISNIKKYRSAVEKVRNDLTNQLDGPTLLGVTLMYGAEYGPLKKHAGQTRLVQAKKLEINRLNDLIDSIQIKTVRHDLYKDQEQTITAEIANIDQLLSTTTDLAKRQLLITRRLAKLEEKAKVLEGLLKLRDDLPRNIDLANGANEILTYISLVVEKQGVLDGLVENLAKNTKELDGAKEYVKSQILDWELDLTEVNNQLSQVMHQLELYKNELVTLQTNWDNIAYDLVTDVSFDNFYQVVGDAGNSYVSRGKYYISADLGFAYLHFKEGPSTVSPYFGVNFNLLPINKEAHYSLFQPLKGYKRRTAMEPKRGVMFLKSVSVMLGITFANFTEDHENRSSVMGDDEAAKKLNLITGMGLRLTDHTRISTGVSWTMFESNPNLKNTKKISPNWFFSLSVDLDVKKYLGAIGNLFNKNKIQ